MSMLAGRPGAGRDEVGEKVASFPTYEQAQKAVSSLIAGEVPARDIAIVGTGLRSIERITGRLGYATAARSGALNGLMIGLLFAFIFVLGQPTVQIATFLGVLLVGMALGMLLSLGTYSLIRRRRDFASVMQVSADHYDVCVAAASLHKARGVLGPTGTARTVVARPPVSVDDARHRRRAPRRLRLRQPVTSRPATGSASSHRRRSPGATPPSTARLLPSLPPSRPEPSRPVPSRPVLRRPRLRATSGDRRARPHPRRPAERRLERLGPVGRARSYVRHDRSGARSGSGHDPSLPRGPRHRPRRRRLRRVAVRLPLRRGRTPDARTRRCGDAHVGSCAGMVRRDVGAGGVRGRGEVVRRPQFFVEGENDPFVDPHEQLVEAVASCPDARVHWIAGATHSFEVKGARRPADEIGAGLAPVVAGFVRAL
ncbi:MAG: hypothetical protein K0R81_3502 [Microbacterium sp.]|nr:hypothetical protein [Microbacterium sp.]